MNILRMCIPSPCGRIRTHTLSTVPSLSWMTCDISSKYMLQYRDRENGAGEDRNNRDSLHTKQPIRVTGYQYRKGSLPQDLQEWGGENRGNSDGVQGKRNPGSQGYSVERGQHTPGPP